MTTMTAGTVTHIIEARATKPQRRQLIAFADKLGVDTYTYQGSGHRSWTRVKVDSYEAAMALAEAALAGGATRVQYVTRTVVDPDVGSYRQSAIVDITADTLAAILEVNTPAPVDEVGEANPGDISRVDPGMHPKLDLPVEHNLGAEQAWVAIRVALAAQQARELVADLYGTVTLNIADADGPVAEVILYASSPTACVRDVRTGWALQVSTFEDEDGDPYVRVIDAELAEVV